MKYLVGFLIAAGCGGPTQQQLAETPTATTRPVKTEAPAASTSDLDRQGLRQSFDDMENAQNAYREANNEREGKGQGSAVAPAPPAPPKQGPAVQAPKKGPAEQAPKP
jgi:hypothetical protein